MQSQISWHSSGFVIFKWGMISAADVLRVRLNYVCKSVYKHSLSSFPTELRALPMSIGFFLLGDIGKNLKY